MESDNEDIDPVPSAKPLGMIVVTRKRKLSQAEAPEASTSQLPPITIPPLICQLSMDNMLPPPSSAVPSNILNKVPFWFRSEQLEHQMTMELVPFSLPSFPLPSNAHSSDCAFHLDLLHDQLVTAQEDLFIANKTSCICGEQLCCLRFHHSAERLVLTKRIAELERQLCDVGGA